MWREAGAGRAREHSTVEDDSGVKWQARFFVLFGGGKNVPKLMWYTKEEEYEQQRREKEETGFGWFSPKGQLDLVGASTDFPGERCEPEVAVFAVRTPMHVLSHACCN